MQPLGLYEPFLKLGSGFSLVLCNNETKIQVIRTFRVARSFQSSERLEDRLFEELWWLSTNTMPVTREPRARDSGTKGPREYWWEAPNRGSTDREHRASGVSVANWEASAGTPS